MKKLTLLMLLLFVSGMMFAQFHIGPQIGYTSSKLTTNWEDSKSSFQSNFLFGAFARFGEKIYVQPEVNWLTQKGVWEEDVAGSDPSEIEINYKTIQIPVSIGWRIIDLKLANIRVFGGASASIVTNKDLKFKNLADPIKEADLSDLIWQYQVGAGVDVLMFALDIKYMGGLNDMFKNDVVLEPGGNTLTTKSNLFMVTLGWKIF
jgi:hypothetical protein